MNEKEITDLRAHLEQLETSALDEMLRAEVEKESPNAEAVRLIMAILEAREAGELNHIDPATIPAWEKYKLALENPKAELAGVPFMKFNWLLKVASAVLILGILFSMIPQDVKADGIFGRLWRWTDSIFEMFTPDSVNNNRVEYVFETDHPGLQQVYDAVTELGITEPVVPMWLPDGYELVDCKKMDSSHKTGISAKFTDSNEIAIYTVDCYHNDAASEFHKDLHDVYIYEKAGVSHAIMRNNDSWIVVWSRDNIKG